MTGAIGINLGMCNFWNPTGLLYADAMRSAQGFAYDAQQADALGNPLTPGSKVIVWQYLSAAAGAGVYQFIATGKCSLALGPTTVQGVTIFPPVYDAAKNQTTCTLTVPAPTAANPWPSTSQLAIQVNWAPTDAPPTNIQLWRPGAKVGDLFYQPFLNLLAPFSTVRFMDALQTNGSTLADWSKRPLPMQRNYQSGIAWEDAFALGAQTGKAIWLNVPYLVATSPGGLDAVAQWLRSKANRNLSSPMPPAIYVEISNEIWNSAFPQWQQNQTAAAANPAVTYDGANVQVAGWRQPAYLTMLLTQAIEKAYGFDWRATPIRPVLGWQWGDPRIAAEQLAFISLRYGPPAKFFYAGSEAPYCTVDWSKNPKAAADLDADLLTGNPDNASSQQNAALAAAAGIKFSCYEFGKDFGQDPANSAIRDQAQSLPAAGTTELAALAAWGQLGGGLLCYYQAAYRNQPSGDWGLVQDVFDLNTPRYQAVAQTAALMWFDETPLPLPAQPSPTPAPVQTPAPLVSIPLTDATGRKLALTIAAA